MTCAMHNESPRYSRYGYDGAKSAALVANFVKNGGGYVAEKDGKLVGMAAACAVEAPFSKDVYAGSLYLYVIPAARGSTAFIKLVKEIEKWMRAKNPVDMVLSVSTGVETEKTVNLCQRLGYEIECYSLIKRMR